jgi:hypothetical protein
MRKAITLVNESDFQLSGDQFVLRHGHYPVLPGSFCDDPRSGAKLYNEALTRYLNYNRRRTDLRVQLMLEKRACNHRIVRLRSIINRGLQKAVDIRSMSNIERKLFLLMLCYS